MKLLVINQYYTPDVSSTGKLAAEICSSLAERGIEVHVVTGQPSYSAASGSAPASEVLDGVRVNRIAMGRARGRERLLIRAFGYLRFLFGAHFLSSKIAREISPDAVLTFHNPPFVGLIGARIAKKFGAKFTYVPYDIHPDILIATNWIKLPKPALKVWEGLNKRILGSASAVVALGEGMKETLASKNVDKEKIHVVQLWGRPEITATSGAAIRNELGVQPNELLLLYSGNMGIMHPLEIFIDAAAVAENVPIKMVFVGDGAKRKDLQKRARSCGKVLFLPFQSESRFEEIVAASDACLVALEPGLEKLALPSRAFTFLSAGKPLITAMSPDADVARLAAEEFCGWNVENADELASLLKELVEYPNLLRRASINAANVYNERFRRDKIIGKYYEVIAGSL